MYLSDPGKWLAVFYEGHFQSFKQKRDNSIVQSLQAVFVPWYSGFKVTIL